MNKILDSLHEIHLYNSKIEYFIRGIIWFASWGFGIYLSYNDQPLVGNDSRALSYACFVFALSLLTEFAKRLLDNRDYLLASRIIICLFCLIIAVLLFLSLTAIIGKPLFESNSQIMYYLSISIMGYMIIDFILLCLCRNKPQSEYILIESKEKDEAKEKFINNIKNGKMGGI